MEENTLLQIKNKKGVSIMIGYVLLITFALVSGIVAYNWLKTYVPTEPLSCPEGVSILIKNISCQGNGNDILLDLTLRNNGRFDIAGYFIYATNSSEQELATIDLSPYSNLNKNMEGLVLFSIGTDNPLNPNEEITNNFIIDNPDFNQINSVEIIPIRFQEEDNRKRFVNCGSARVKEEITCTI